MLRIIIGADWISNREKVLSLLTDDIKNRRPGRILMVPELISHDTERRLCSAAGDTASRYAEVMSFPQLLTRFSETEALVPEKCMDNGGRLVAMASATRNLSGQLKVYASVASNPEFLTSLVDMVDEFKRCLITSDVLMEASVQATGTLAQKLMELALILETYEGICNQGLRDPRDQMNWLLEEMEVSNYCENHCFYVDGFPDLTRQHMEIISHMIRVSPMVTISMNCDDIHTDRVAFETAARTAREFIRVAQEAKIPVKYITTQERNDPLKSVRASIFQGPIESSQELKGHLVLTRSSGIFDECLAAAERIQTLVAKGCRYRDIGVVSTDMEHYRGILSLVFRRCNIPAYLSGTDDILEKTAVVTVLSALDAALNGLEQRDVLRYLKSILSPLDPDMCDKVENYVITWGIRGEKWNQEWKNHPAGLNKDWDEESEALLAALNEAREKGVVPLVRLRAELKKGTCVADMVNALNGFLDEIQLAQNLEQLAQQADKRGDNRTAQEFNQLWEIILSAMEQLRDSIGEDAWDEETFTRLFRLLLSQYDVGTIPTVLDSVTIGPVSAMRCQQVKHMIILGAEEGKLPSYTGSSGLLTDKERDEMRSLGVTLTGGGMEGVCAEYAELYGVFCGATDTIHVSCPASQPSYIYRRLCDLLGVSDGTFIDAGPGPGLTDRWEAGAYLARWDAEDTAQELDVLSGFHETRSKATYSMGKLTRKQAKKLYGKKLKLSATQIDLYSECKMSYFLRYGLQAKERKEAKIDSAEFGSFVHSVLERSAKEIKKAGGFSNVSQDQALAIARKHAKDYADKCVGQMDSERLAYLFRRNGMELDAVVKELWGEMSEAKFSPVAFELKFGEEGEMPAVKIDGKSMGAELRGFVDRVDQWTDGLRNFFRVIDYKTGRKDFDYCDVFNGVGLQMLLYLFALEEEGQKVLGENRVPAGIQYFPARMPYLNEDGHLTPEQAEQVREKDLKRKGLVLRDDAVIRAMDPDGDMKRLNCKRLSDGKLSGDIADSAQFKQLRTYIYRLLKKMVDSIADGEIAPDPYTRGTSHNACTYCPYGAVCARTREGGRRNYKAMTSQRFWEEVEKENNKDHE